MSVGQQHHAGVDIVVGILMTMVPDWAMPLAGKVGVAFVCGFASVAGQALWRLIMERKKK